MPTVSISPVLTGQALDNQGNILSGGKIFAYEGGSFSVLATTYTTAAGDVANPNPIITDTSGRIPPMFLVIDQTYNITLAKSDGSTILETYENVSGAATAVAVQDLIDASVTGFLPNTGGTVTGSLTVTGVTSAGSLNAATLTTSGNITSAGVVTAAGLDADSEKVTNVATPTLSTDAATKGYVDTLAGTSGIPIGGIVTWAVTAPPVNWLVCDGTPVSRTTYSGLFSILGTLYGAGDGTTTFNIPDYRGSFLRGFDAGAGLDPARALATYQADEFASHTHTFPGDTTGGFNTPINSIVAGDRGATATGTVINSTGGTETRPKNWSVQFIIRAL